MKMVVSALALTGLLILSFIFVYRIHMNAEIGPFNVNDIYANESELQIATDLSIGKGTRLMKTVTEDSRIYTLFEVHPYHGEFGIASFLPAAKRNKYKFGSASYSLNPIQAKALSAKGNERVVIAVRRGTPISKLVISTAGQSVEKAVVKEKDFLETIGFEASVAGAEIKVVGYDEQGRELASTTVRAE